nr:MAG TPA: hypothetical protein [Caudoviricetes sp.]DAU03756.1 MAG TPA: hypothetical protein [Caudoviricetes sp.]
MLFQRFKLTDCFLHSFCRRKEWLLFIWIFLRSHFMPSSCFPSPLVLSRG